MKELKRGRHEGPLKRPMTLAEYALEWRESAEGLEWEAADHVRRLSHNGTRVGFDLTLTRKAFDHLIEIAVADGTYATDIILKATYEYLKARKAETEAG